MFSLTSGTANTEIAQICLIYMLEPGLAVMDFDQYPLSKSAASFWYRHFKSIESRSSKLDNLILQFFRCPKEKFFHFIRWLEQIETEFYSSRPNANPVYYASLLGLGWFIEELM